MENYSFKEYQIGIHIGTIKIFIVCIARYRSVNNHVIEYIGRCNLNR